MSRRIHKRREDGYRNLPDGKGGLKEYFTHADYELIIDKVNRDKFANEIGFLESAKQKQSGSIYQRQDPRFQFRII